jgi:hypothetical protein
LETSKILDLLLESFIQKLQQQQQQSAQGDFSPAQQQLVKELQESIRQVIYQHRVEEQQQRQQHAAVRQEEVNAGDNNGDNDFKMLRLAEMENDWLWSIMMPELVQQLCNAHIQVERGQIHLNAMKQVMAALAAGHDDDSEHQQQQKQQRRIDKQLLVSSRAAVGSPHVLLVKQHEEEEKEEEQKSPAAAHDHDDDHHHRLGALYPNVTEDEVVDKSRGSSDNDGKPKGRWWSWKSRLLGNHRHRWR